MMDEKKLKTRVEVVKAMDTIARCLNDEDIFYDSWLVTGVADGDIEAAESDEDLEYYCEDKNFADLMGLFVRCMKRAFYSGGLYCDGVVDSNETKTIKHSKENSETPKEYTYEELADAMKEKGTNMADVAIGRMMNIVETETGRFPDWDEKAPDWVVKQAMGEKTPVAELKKGKSI